MKDAIPIITFVNDSDSYADMRHSFEDAGFTPDRARFEPLEGGAAHDLAEPYGTITTVISLRPEPYVVLCHQDVRLDQGHTYSDFVRAMEGLDAHDPLWAVAGNAGGLRRLNVVRCITDPTGGRTRHKLPARVHSLDENFLVVKTGTGIGCSRELSGFHFYGSDLCLNVLESGRRAYVIDFHLHHLSAGRRDDAYRRAREQLVDLWAPRFTACYVRTSIEVLFLGRWTVLRRTLGHPRLCKVLKNHFKVAIVFGLVLGRRTE